MNVFTGKEGGRVGQGKKLAGRGRGRGNEWEWRKKTMREYVEVFIQDKLKLITVTVISVILISSYAVSCQKV